MGMKERKAMCSCFFRPNTSLEEPSETWPDVASGREAQGWKGASHWWKEAIIYLMTKKLAAQRSHAFCDLIGEVLGGSSVDCLITDQGSSLPIACLLGPWWVWPSAVPGVFSLRVLPWSAEVKSLYVPTHTLILYLTQHLSAGLDITWWNVWYCKHPGKGLFGGAMDGHHFSEKLGKYSELLLKHGLLYISMTNL
jgi:hypothetical protein